MGVICSKRLGSKSSTQYRHAALALSLSHRSLGVSHHACMYMMSVRAEGRVGGEHHHITTSRTATTSSSSSSTTHCCCCSWHRKHARTCIGHGPVPASVNGCVSGAAVHLAPCYGPSRFLQTRQR